MRRVVASDLPDICGWYEVRGTPAPRYTSFPAIGMIEDEVAAGFLYRTDSDIGWLEGYISNPAAELRRRTDALTLLTAALLEEARSRGVRTVVALAKTRGIERLSSRFGMRRCGVYAMMERSL